MLSHTTMSTGGTRPSPRAEASIASKRCRHCPASCTSAACASRHTASGFGFLPAPGCRSAAGRPVVMFFQSA